MLAGQMSGRVDDRLGVRYPLHIVHVELPVRRVRELCPLDRNRQLPEPVKTRGERVHGLTLRFGYSIKSS